jgi:hypothetical protein
VTVLFSQTESRHENRTIKAFQGVVFQKVVGDFSRLIIVKRQQTLIVVSFGREGRFIPQ